MSRGLTKTRDAAHGRWDAIMGHLGYTSALGGKHTDCPICDAKKKFRYTNYKGNGEWICTCGSGDGFDLLMGAEGLQFDAAAKVVDGIIGNNELEETFKPAVDYEKRRRDLNQLWAGAQDFTLVYDYLLSRGIPDHGTGFKGLQSDLRGHTELYNADTGERQPGMCALIRNKRGQPVSIHRTFFDPKAKKIMPPTEAIAGAGVRLGWASEASIGKTSLIIGEGIETTLAGMAHARVPGLAAISAHGMETLDVPDRFETIKILADNDRSFTGQKAAFTLARKLDQAKRDVEVIMCNQPAHDFLDFKRNTLAQLWNWRNERG